MTVLLFEDEGYRSLLPLVYARPVSELRCGAFTLRERAAALLQSRGGEKPATLCRSYMMGYYGPPNGLGGLLGRSEPLVLVNGRAQSLNWLPALLDEPVESVYVSDDVLLGAKLSPALASTVLPYLRQQWGAEALAELRRFARVKEQTVQLLRFPWDLITRNGEQIIDDLPLLLSTRVCVPFSQLAELHPHVVVYDPDHVYLAPGARLDGPLALDARNGPVVIEDAQIEPLSFIQGPAYVGRGALISSALLRGETSIGPVCRIGGEVEASIVQGYSNKHHEGFLGHSFLGEWVNIGAMTTTSDLKNTYGSIKVVLDGLGQLDSGQLKLGCFLADHVKLGIGLHLNGGGVIGVGSNIFGVHAAPKTVPPFTWGGEVFREYRIDGMVEVTRKVMGRRKLMLAPAYEALLREVFAMTRASRDVVLSGPLSIAQSEAAAAALLRAESEAVRAF